MTRKEEEKLVKIFKALGEKIKEQYERREPCPTNCKDATKVFHWAVDAGKRLGMIELKDYLDSMLKEEFGGKNDIL